MDEDVRKEISTRLTVAVPTAGRAFRIGRNASYDAARRGDFPTIKIGSAIRVPTAWISRKLGLETEGVSTARQGRSGLGLEAQQAAIGRFCEAEGFEVVAEHVEVETGKGTDALDRRPAA